MRAAHSDDVWMDAAARLSARARPLSRPNPGVAALVVRDDQLIARGWTQAGGRPHAEAHALSAFSQDGAKGATIYVTLEPCAHKSERGPSCADLLASAQPARVVIGQTDPDPRTAGAGAERLRAAGIDVTILDHAGAERSLSGYLTRTKLSRPYVTLKLAMSLDGCIALADGTSQWITGEASRAHVHAQRARNDAILVGGGTWRADKPRLDVRLPGLETRGPSRVVLTRRDALEGVQTIGSPNEISALEGVQHLYLEGGAQTATSFLREDLVDELHLYRAPIVIGDGLRGLGALELNSLDAAHGRWAGADHRQLGRDTFTSYLRQR